MANDGHRLFIDDSTNPDTGISIADIQTVLGTSAYSDIGGLITYGAINPWALYKPICANIKGMVVRDDFDRLGFGTSTRATSLPYATSVSGLITLYEDGESNYLWRTVPANGWRYLKPRGGSNNEWFRFFDFVKIVSVSSVLQPVADSGYDHQAKNPFGSFNCVESVSRYGGAFSGNNQNGRVVPTGGVSEEDITIGDINSRITGSANDMLYYGILLVPVPFTSSGASCKVLFNNSETINDGNTDDVRGGETLSLTSVILNNTTWPEQEYLAYPFLTNIVISSSARVIDITYANRNSNITSDAPRLYPLPGSTPITVNVYSTLVVINVETVGVVDSRNGGQIYITIKNNSTSAINIPRLEMQFRTGGATFSTARRTGEVFYDGEKRYDDNYSSGTADNSYASFLRPSGGYDVSANGGEIRIPPTTGMTLSVTLPSTDASWLIVGDPANPNVYGGAQFILPITPNSQVVEP